MPSVAIHTILGPLPLLRGLFRWSLAVIFAVGAWHLYLWSPLPGLVAIGITPVLAIFFFLTSSAVPSPTGKRAVLSASSVCTPHGGTPGLVIC